MIRLARPAFQLLLPCCASFAAFRLFEKQKTPKDLHPIFALPTRIPGQLSHFGKATEHDSPRKKLRQRPKRYRMKDHSGLRKRLRLRGPLRLRRFKFMSAGKRHLNTNRTQANLLRKRRARYVAKADTWKVRRLLPSYRKNSFKRRQ